MTELRTTDSRTAGFLQARGVRWIGTLIADSGDCIFRFDDSDGVATATVGEYDCSSESRYDVACRTMYGVARATADKKR